MRYQHHGMFVCISVAARCTLHRVCAVSVYVCLSVRDGTRISMKYLNAVVHLVFYLSHLNMRRSPGECANAKRRKRFYRPTIIFYLLDWIY